MSEAARRYLDLYRRYLGLHAAGKHAEARSLAHGSVALWRSLGEDDKDAVLALTRSEELKVLKDRR